MAPTDEVGARRNLGLSGLAMGSDITKNSMKWGTLQGLLAPITKPHTSQTSSPAGPVISLEKFRVRLKQSGRGSPGKEREDVCELLSR